MIRLLEEALDETSFGGKAVQLGHALRAGLPVPPGVALAHEAVERIAGGEAALFASVAGRLPRGARFAVRSSAVGEDSAGASFAGQHATVLGVRTEEALRDAIVRVHASGRDPSALAYRRKLGLGGAPRMGVVVQALVHAEVAGVLFSRDPLSGEDVRTVEASWGLGEAVVAGLVTPDRYRIARGGRVLEKHAGEKDLAIRWSESGDGTEEHAIDDHRVEAHCLDEAMLLALDALCTRCEAHFGGSQDLEFAFADGALHLLQRRAITRG